MIMGMATSKVRLNICGSSYVVNTSESEDYMQNLADRLNLDMNELMASSNSVSITTAAVMTALNYRDELENAGLVISAVNDEHGLVEVVELPDHPFFIACQYHPEFQSAPNRAHPLFSGLVSAALEHKSHS